MPIPKEFPTSEELQRVKCEDDYYRLYVCEYQDHQGKTDRGKFRLKEFFGDNKKKADILDQAFNIAPIAIDATTDFLFGEPVKIAVNGEGKEKLQEALDELLTRVGLLRKLKESSALFQTVGHTQFKIYRDENGQACLEEVPYDYYFPNWAGVPMGQESKDIRIAVWITRAEPGQPAKRYIYVENYYLKDKKAVCAKSLWEEQGGRIGTQVSLDTLQIPYNSAAKPEDGNTLTMVEETGLPELPVVVLNARKTVKQRMGESALKKALPLIYEINDRLTQVSIQFLKHLNAKLQIPDGSVVRDDKGNVQRKDMDVLIARAGEPEAKYITNENPLVEQAFEHLEASIRKFAKLMQVPDWFFTDDEKGGVEKVESLRVRIMALLKKIKNYQTTYDEGIKNIVRLLCLVEGKADLAKETLKITYDLGLPKDWQGDVTVWGTALVDGIASKETAVGRFQGIEGDELKKEMARIEKDQQAMMQSQIDLLNAKAPPGDGGGQNG